MWVAVVMAILAYQTRQTYAGVHPALWVLSCGQQLDEPENMLSTLFSKFL